jgi:methylase of polypeptide subunit release factors
MGARGGRPAATALAVEAIERAAPAALARVAGRAERAEAYAALQRGLYRSLFEGLLSGPLPGGLFAGAVPVEAPFALEDPADVGRLHEDLKTLSPRWEDGALRLRPGSARRTAGAFYTPAALIEHLLDTALEPVLDSVSDAAVVRVCDPTCGSGLFLVAAARRIAARLGRPDLAVGCVHGVDNDPVAVDLARAALWVEAGCPDDVAPFLDAVVVGDALSDPWSPAYDVVVGNPPFLNQLETATRLGIDAARAARATVGGASGAYTDLSAMILLRSLDLVRAGGRVALVQPQSLLAARDAAPVRSALLRRAALAHLWASDEPVFEAASVLTCAPTLVVGGEQGAVSVTHGRSFEPMPAANGPLDDSWSHLLASGLGIPSVDIVPSGVLGDLALCTADFRDQFYGLVPFVADGDADDGHPKLITSGLIEPAASLWGERATRFAKQRFVSPVVSLAGLRDSPLAEWAARRLVPKVLVATQSRVLEAVVDEQGEWLPSVPVITVTPPPDRLWHVLAVLCAPPVTAYAATHWAGTGLTMRAIKLSAKQVATLPLPADAALWDEGAELARRAQLAASPSVRDSSLRDLARVMTAAYSSSDEILEWWLERARLG